MKRIIIFVLIISDFIFAQYFGERNTEQSFEQSDLFFKSHYLNSFGIFNFKEIVPGLIDDPFLNIYLNPAVSPQLNEKDFLFYLDFRGDRTKSPLVESYIMPTIYSEIRIAPYPYPYFDPRWFAKTRTEPEPIVSAGLIVNPISELTKDFFIGGSYQVINKEENFYSIPYWIYYPNYYYDALGIRAEGLRSVPIQDRYAGRDEMMTEGHLFSAFTGYKFDDFSFGFSLNGVIHSRDGGYFNQYKDEYGTANNQDWENSQSEGRIQDYEHLDYSAGISYSLSPQTSLGIKAGILNGNAVQNYNSRNYNFTSNNTPEASEDWYYNISNYSTEQNWNQDGTSKYFGINFSRLIKENNRINLYYKFTTSDVDLTNNTQISDSSFYTSRWYSNYDTSWYRYSGSSRVNDIRNGNGERLKKIHESMISFQWNLSGKTTLVTGFYYKKEKSETFSYEPVNVFRESSYNHSNSSGLNNYNQFNSLLEDKTLEWNYSSDYWTFQIPVILDFEINESVGVMLGINKIFQSWKIKDQTTAYFNLRQSNENGTITTETNFGERYMQPDDNFTENKVQAFGSIYVNFSDQFKVRLLVDPEIEGVLRLAQWWLSFEAKI